MVPKDYKSKIHKKDYKVDTPSYISPKYYIDKFIEWLNHRNNQNRVNRLTTIQECENLLKYFAEDYD